MGRSHPPTLITLARRLVEDEHLVPRGGRVLAAVSGGPDSMAMLDVLARLRRPCDFTLVAHGVDHGLRPQAPAELELAARLARALDVAFATTRVDLEPGGNLQARARDLRFAALRDAARAASADVIATAHHADDRAETVLLRLLRGSGPRGLACLPPRSGDLIRPLLRARRGDVLSHLDRHGIPFADDPSNDDARFARVRVRREVLPLLRDLSPGIVGHLNALADDLGRLPDDMWPPGTRRVHRTMAARGPARVRESDCEETFVSFAPRALMVTKLRRPGPPAAEPVDGGPAGWQASKSMGPDVGAPRPGERKRRP